MKAFRDLRLFTAIFFSLKLWCRNKLSKVFATGACSLLCALSALQAQPVWWDTYNAVDDTLSSSHHDVVLVGQFKHFATQTKAYIDATLGTTPADWDAAYPPGQNPFPFPPGPSSSNKGVLLQGQAKFVLDGIYNVLIAAGVNTTEALEVYAGPDSPWLHPKPWTADDTTDDTHKSPLLQGQLKWMLSFDLAAFPPVATVVDADNDGLTDAWELQYYADIALYGFYDDPDNDGYHMGQEELAGTDPNEVPYSIVVVSGNNQSGTLGTLLGSPATPVILRVEQGGVPVSGFPLHLNPETITALIGLQSDGSDLIAEINTITDAQGEVAFYIQL